MTLRWVPGWNGLTEPEAVSYVAAVEAADGEPLEFGVAKAINDFVLGCKNDGIWNAIKASCILAGARTLAGALVPLVGTAPTNVSGLFAAGDYNRKTGLVGDGSTKYLDSNRNNNADPQDNNHNSSFISTLGNGAVISSATGGSTPGTNIIGSTNMRNRADSTPSFTLTSGFVGHSRFQSGSFSYRNSGATLSASIASQSPDPNNVLVFASATNRGTHRIAFYSIGEALNLEKLDTRVTRLMNLITYTQTAGLPDLSTMDMDAAAYIGGAYRAGGTLS